jgi:hypothetical protein
LYCEYLSRSQKLPVVSESSGRDGERRFSAMFCKPLTGPARAASTKEEK